MRSRGVELGFRQPFAGALTLSAHLAHQQVRNAVKTDAALGTELPGVPRRYGALGAEWRTGPTRLWANVLLVGRRQGDVSNTFVAPGYSRVDLGVIATLGHATQVVASAQNLFDKRYVEAITDADNVYQGERRRFVLTLRQSW